MRAGGLYAHGRRVEADLGQEFVKQAGGFTNSCAPQGLSATICETAVLRILARHARSRLLVGGRDCWTERTVPFLCGF